LQQLVLLDLINLLSNFHMLLENYYTCDCDLEFLVNLGKFMRKESANYWATA